MLDWHVLESGLFGSTLWNDYLVCFDALVISFILPIVILKGRHFYFVESVGYIASMHVWSWILIVCVHLDWRPYAFAECF